MFAREVGDGRLIVCARLSGNPRRTGCYGKKLSLRDTHFIRQTSDGKEGNIAIKHITFPVDLVRKRVKIYVEIQEDEGL